MLRKGQERGIVKCEFGFLANQSPDISRGRACSIWQKPQSLSQFLLASELSYFFISTNFGFPKFAGAFEGACDMGFDRFPCWRLEQIRIEFEVPPVPSDYDFKHLKHVWDKDVMSAGILTHSLKSLPRTTFSFLDPNTHIWTSDGHPWCDELGAKVECLELSHTCGT